MAIRQRTRIGEVKDSFRDWNLLHKSVIVLIVAFFVGIVYNAVNVIDGAFLLEEETTLPYDAETIWPWIYDAERRPDWQAYVIDSTPYTGDPQEAGSTRLIFWQKGYDRWHAIERTSEVVQARLYSTYQESDQDRRWLRLELEPIGPCATRIRIEETVFPLDYEERFWFFRHRDEAQERLTISLKALERWLGTKEGVCKPD